MMTHLLVDRQDVGRRGDSMQDGRRADAGLVGAGASSTQWRQQAQTEAA